MNRLKQLEALGLPINWTTILVGWEGPGKLLRQLDVKDVVGYVWDSHGKTGEDLPERVLDLLAVRDSDASRVGELLVDLASTEEAERSTEEAKWRLLLLLEHLESDCSDPWDGLIGLTEFWEAFDYPEDSPHLVQGRGNIIPPEDYYTEATYRLLLSLHRRWAEKELQRLRSAS